MEYRNPNTWNDRWAIEHVFKEKRDGFFVEAGALNGKNSSSTYLLEKNYNWKGILVEPSPEMFEALCVNRPKSKCFDCCLYDTNKEIDFINFSENLGWSGIEENWHENRDVHPQKDKHQVLKKQALTLECLLDKAEAPTIIDYLALDAEGSEFKILKNFNFEKYKFKAISSESYTNQAASVKKILQENDYIQVGNPFSEVYHEAYFIHQDYIEINYKL